MGNQQSHVSRAVCQLLGARPDAIGVADGVIFSEMEVLRKLTFSETERPTKVKAFVAYGSLGEQYIWALESHRPVPGKPYVMFFLEAMADRQGRRFQEIPCLPDTSLLGLDERTGKTGTLVVETTLQVVKIPAKKAKGTRPAKEAYELVMGFGPMGKLVRVRHGVTLPIGKKCRFAVLPKGLETLEAYGLAQEEQQEAETNDASIVRVSGSKFSWLEQLRLSERDVKVSSEEHLQEVIDDRLKSVRGAYAEAVKSSRLMRGFKDPVAEEEIKRKLFPKLVILEACAVKALEWHAANKESFKADRSKREAAATSEQ